MHKIFISLLIVTLLGCDKGDPYQGIWYFQDNDNKQETYLDARDTNNVIYKQCSLHDGYVTDKLAESLGSTRIEGDKLITTTIDGAEHSQTLFFSKGQLTLTSEYSRRTFVKKTQIPSFCENSAIKITSISPSYLEEDIEVELTVYFEYRADIGAKIYLCLPGIFTDFSSCAHAGEGKLLDETYLSSGNISATIRPVVSTDLQKYRVILVLNHIEDSTGWTNFDFMNVDIQGADE